MRRAILAGANPDCRPPTFPISRFARTRRLLSILGSDATVRALLKEAVVLGIEESRPAREYECSVSLPFINAIPPYQGLDGHEYSENGDRAMVAFVDDGIDVLHEAFLDDNGQSRIVGIWDQRDGTGPPPAGFTFGTYYSRDDIARFLTGKSVPRRSAGTGADTAPTSRASLPAAGPRSLPAASRPRRNCWSSSRRAISQPGTRMHTLRHSSSSMRWRRSAGSLSS